LKIVSAKDDFRAYFIYIFILTPFKYLFKIFFFFLKKRTKIVSTRDDFGGFIFFKTLIFLNVKKKHLIFFTALLILIVNFFSQTYFPVSLSLRRHSLSQFSAPALIDDSLSPATLSAFSVPATLSAVLCSGSHQRLELFSLSLSPLLCSSLLRSSRRSLVQHRLVLFTAFTIIAYAF
jgi:hypothetical protein